MYVTRKVALASEANLHVFRFSSVAFASMGGAGDFSSVFATTPFLTVTSTCTVPEIPAIRAIGGYNGTSAWLTDGSSSPVVRVDAEDVFDPLGHRKKGTSCGTGSTFFIECTI